MAYQPRVVQTEFPVHVTARTNNREPFPIPLETVWEVVVDYLAFCHRGFEIKIHAVVLMPNHIHMILRDPAGTLPKAMLYFMKETSREIGRLSRASNHRWGGPYHSSIINSERYYLTAYKYVYRNPVAAKLCLSPIEWEFSTLRALLGFRGIGLPLEEDSTLFNDTTGTTKWLDASYSEQEATSIKHGFRRTEFSIAVDRKSRRIPRIEIPNAALNQIPGPTFRCR